MVSVWKTVIVAAGIALAVPSCGGGGSSADTGGCTTPTGGVTGTVATGTATTVKVVSDPTTVGKFDPQTVTVKAGTSVTWDFQDQGTSHTVTADNASFDSCLQAAGFKFTVTFPTAGDFPYKCTVHAAMTGDVKVS